MNYIVAIARDIRAQVSDDDLPDVDTDDLFLLYALLALVKGEGVDDADIHDAWTTWMALHDEDHPAMVPFAELEPETQSQDTLFAEAVRHVAAKLRDRR